MITFPIEFRHNGKTYKAQVQKVTSPPLQYLVSEFDPSDLGAQDPFVLTVNKGKSQLEWGIDPSGHLLLGDAIYRAIVAECKKRGIPVLD